MGSELMGSIPLASGECPMSNCVLGLARADSVSTHPRKRGQWDRPLGLKETRWHITATTQAVVRSDYRKGGKVEVGNRKITIMGWREQDP